MMSNTSMDTRFYAPRNMRSNLKVQNYFFGAAKFDHVLTERAVQFSCQNSVPDVLTIKEQVGKDVFPQMIITEFYEGDLAKTSPGDCIPSRKKLLGRKILMQEMFSRNTDHEHPRRIILVGPAGSGKTTILKRFVGGKIFSNFGQRRVLVNDPETLVCVINGQDYVQSHQRNDLISLAEFLFPAEKPNDLTLNRDLRWMIQNPARIIFVIDSLDTLPFSLTGNHPRVRPGDKATAATFMKNLLSNRLFPGCRILASSREYAVADFGGDLRPDRVVALDGFSEHSKKKFIRRVLGKNGLAFIEEMENKYPDLWLLCSTPMFLMFTLTVDAEKLKSDFVPSTMSGIVIRLLQIILHSEHGLESFEIDSSNVISKLKQLSFDGMKKAQISFTQSDLEDIKLDHAKASSLTLRVPGFGRKQGFSNNLLIGKNVMFFCHLSIQEAFCALHAVEMPTEQFSQFLTEELSKPHMLMVRRFISGVLLEENVFKEARKEKLIVDIKDVEQKRNEFSEFMRQQMSQRRNKQDQLELYVALHEAGGGAKPILERWVKSIDLAGLHLTPPTMHAVGSIINQCGEIRNLTLSDCSITPVLMNALDNAIGPNCVKIENLNMSKNWEFGAKGMVHLGNVVEKCQISSVALDGCNITAEQLKQLNDSLVGYKLTMLSMGEDVFEGPTVVGDILREACRLLDRVKKKIDLHGWTIDEIGKRAIEKELQRNYERDKYSELVLIIEKNGEKTIEAETFERVYEWVTRKIYSFKDFARRSLRLSEIEINDIEKENPRCRKEAKIKMLEKWREQQGNDATCAKLKRLVAEFSDAE